MQQEKSDVERDAGAARKPWTAPELGELEISRTANNPSVLSDGGVADCNHV
ncbi:hypothetical protein OF829_12535 [Sphingomonas sp. LB-2]|uniref:hypothetical protein n=1 Tax=Sphingomonas caeni TaxID=2984949 RepID=UPI002231443F|nr:hypothetical protein [Sphingomonas caeni]MCW3848069.1 hypothetical protein [Sphingomonas caeni]